MRGQPIFVLSQLLKFLEPMLRTTAEMAPWQVQLPCSFRKFPLVAFSSPSCITAIHGSCFEHCAAQCRHDRHSLCVYIYLQRLPSFIFGKLVLWSFLCSKTFSSGFIVMHP